MGIDPEVTRCLEKMKADIPWVINNLRHLIRRDRRLQAIEKAAEHYDEYETESTCRQMSEIAAIVAKPDSDFDSPAT